MEKAGRTLITITRPEGHNLPERTIMYETRVSAVGTLSICYPAGERKLELDEVTKANIINITLVLVAKMHRLLELRNEHNESEVNKIVNEIKGELNSVSKLRDGRILHARMVEYDGYKLEVN